MGLKVNIIKVFLFVFLLFAGSISCSNQLIKGSSDKFESYRTDSVKAAISPIRIDNYVANTVFFTVSPTAPCFKIEIEASYVPLNNDERPIPATVYFIVERFFDISGFGAGARSIYVNLGQNYTTSSWVARKDVEICTSKAANNNIFRIRFTTFSDRFTSFNIKLYGDSEAKFYSTEESIKK